MHFQIIPKLYEWYEKQLWNFNIDFCKKIKIIFECGVLLKNRCNHKTQIIIQERMTHDFFKYIKSMDERPLNIETIIAKNENPFSADRCSATYTYYIFEVLFSTERFVFTVSHFPRSKYCVRSWVHSVENLHFPVHT